MEEFSTGVIVWLFFSGYGLGTQDEWVAYKLVFELTGKKYNYWESKTKHKKIKDEAKKIILQKNKDLAKYKRAHSLYQDFPEKIKIQVN